MLDKRELLEAIEHLEDNVRDFKDCERLASLYTIYNFKFAKKDAHEPICELIIRVEEDSEFLSAVNGKQSEKVWNVIDGLMDELADKDPTLYEKTIDKLLH